MGAGRAGWIWIIVWAVVGIGLWLALGFVEASAAIYVVFLLLAFALWGACLLLRQVWEVFAEGEKKNALLRVVATAAISVALLYGGLLLTQAGFFAKFLLLRPTYDAIVAEIGLGRMPSGQPEHGVSGVSRGVSYQVDLGPPRRVAFRRPGFRSWSAVIHDPSHALAAATSMSVREGRSVIPPDLRGIFGGNLRGCRRLAGRYYDCGFD
jgi:hypothetical protein